MTRVSGLFFGPPCIRITLTVRVIEPLLSQKGATSFPDRGS